MKASAYYFPRAAQWLCAAAAAIAIHMNASAGEPSSPPQAQQYRFMGGERIKLIVPKEVGEGIEQLVSEDGWVSLPTGGTSVNIRGKTIPEAQSVIGEMLEKQSGAKRVFAAVALLEVPARKVFVGGEVRLPQAIVIPPGTSLTLAAALASAGGATPEADLTRIALTQTTVGAAAKTVTYDASKLGQPDNTDLGPALESGAVITVPRGDIYILAGEVVKPGTYNRRELSLGAGEQATLTRVLFSGGGLKPTGSRKDIRLIRTTRNGEREVVSVNLDDVIRALEKEPREAAPKAPEQNATGAGADPVLMNGDTILVGAAGGVAILGKVKLPGLYPLGGDTLKLTRLIAMAGGFAEFAKSSSVMVIRAAAPKSPLKIDVNAITRDGDLDKDVDLEEGDLVFVGEKML